MGGPADLTSEQTLKLGDSYMSNSVQIFDIDRFLD